MFGPYLFGFEGDFMYVFVYSLFCDDVVPSVSKYVSSVRLNCGFVFFAVRCIYSVLVFVFVMW